MRISREGAEDLLWVQLLWKKSKFLQTLEFLQTTWDFSKMNGYLVRTFSTITSPLPNQNQTMLQRTFGEIKSRPSIIWMTRPHYQEALKFSSLSSHIIAKSRQMYPLIQEAFLTTPSLGTSGPDPSYPEIQGILWGVSRFSGWYPLVFQSYLLD